MGLADTNLSTMTLEKVMPTAPTAAVTGTEGGSEKPKVEAPKENPQTLKSFDVITRKERAIWKAQQELSAEKQAMELERKQFEAYKAEKVKEQERKQTYKTNPGLMLDDYGIDYNTLSEWKLNDQTPTPQMLIKQLQEEIAQFKTQQQEKEATQSEAAKKAQQEYEANVTADFKEQIGTFVASKPDVYEYIKVNEAENLVYDTCEEYYNKHKQLLPIKKACDMVEDYLAKTIETKILATKKLQSKLGQKSTTTTQDPESKPIRTLSNQTMTTSAHYTGISPRNEADRMQRAMAKLGGS